MVKDNCIFRQRKQFPPGFKDRLDFISQLLSTPPVKIVANTTCEEIGCAVFQAELNRLEAVIFIKQPGG